MKWKQSSDQIIYDIMWVFSAIPWYLFTFYFSQGYEDELCKIRKEREDERKTRITELKDESSQVK